MDQWIPLMVAGVGAIAAVGVAFWNSRGEFAELRQMKAMNEVLQGMTGSAQQQALANARDALAVRVAARVTSAPARRRIVWLILGSVATIALIAGATWLLAPYLPATFAKIDLAAWASVLVSVLTVTVAFFASRRSVSAAEMERSRARTAALLRYLEDQAQTSSTDSSTR